MRVRNNGKTDRGNGNNASAMNLLSFPADDRGRVNGAFLSDDRAARPASHRPHRHGYDAARKGAGGFCLANDGAGAARKVGEFVQQAEGVCGVAARCGGHFDFHGMQYAALLNQQVDFVFGAVAVKPDVAQAGLGVHVAFQDFADHKRFKNVPGLCAVAQCFGRSPAREVADQAGIQKIEFRCFGNPFADVR